MDGCEWDRPEASPVLLESERLIQTAAVILTLTVTSDGYVHKGRPANMLVTLMAACC
jgi:hypothetical protein